MAATARFLHKRGLSDVPAFQTEDEKENGAFHEQTFDDVFNNKNLVFQALLINGVLKFAKMEGGMKTLQVLGKETIKGLFDMLDSLGQASAANHVASWANPVLISGVLERFGLLPPAFNNGFHKGITVTAGVDLVSGIVEALIGKGGFPSTLTFAKRAEAELMRAEASLTKALE
jgi:hypothetical protein